MKTRILLLSILLSTLATAQESYYLKAENDAAENRKQWQQQLFQGIEKINFSLSDPNSLLGRDYRLIIKEYQEGKLNKEIIVLDTKEERLPKVDSTFHFTLMTQNLLNNEKIGFFFPRFLNKKIFETRDDFEDGDFSLRKINVQSETLEFNIDEPFQIALITPPNRDPKAGNLGYCEVSQGGIDVEEWYNKYQISQFFLVYMEIE